MINAMYLYRMHVMPMHVHVELRVFGHGCHTSTPTLAHKAAHRAVISSFNIKHLSFFTGKERAARLPLSGLRFVLSLVLL